jgi:hypothetical protein
VSLMGLDCSAILARCGSRRRRSDVVMSRDTICARQEAARQVGTFGSMESGNRHSPRAISPHLCDRRQRRFAPWYSILACIHRGLTLASRSSCSVHFVHGPWRWPMRAGMSLAESSRRPGSVGDDWLAALQRIQQPSLDNSVHPCSCSLQGKQQSVIVLWRRRNKAKGTRSKDAEWLLFVGAPGTGWSQLALFPGSGPCTFWMAFCNSGAN